jgi:Tfp pilus assembly protein PilO
MNGTLDRQFLAQALIILALCVGGWMMIVEPKLSEINRLEAEIAEAKANPALLEQTAVEEMARRIGRVKAQVQAVQQQNQFARDTALIYAEIMDLADDHQVELLRLDPGSRHAGEREPDEESVQKITFDLTIEGTYENVARFLTAVQDIDGFVRPIALAVTPRVVEGRPRVEATLKCEAVSFTLSEALVQFSGGEDADG